MIKLFILCSGIGYIQRGFESFFQDVFDVLSQAKSLDITIFKGKGITEEKQIILWNLPYYAPVNHILSQFFKKAERKNTYFLQQLTFFISLLPYIHLQKPDIIYFSEASLGTLLWHWRSLTKQKYQLLFCNGGPCIPTIFYRWDHIHQVANVHLQTALNIGVPAEKQTLIPHAINISADLRILTNGEREALRYQLGLPEKRPLILSVAAINKYHKRMDYVIQEIASIPEPRPYVLLLGQQEVETPEILLLGNSLLGEDNFQIKTVSKNEVMAYYKIADAFVLASLNEGFGIVFLEAMSYGLPCLAHNYEVTRFILGDEGYLANFELSDSLATLVPQALAESHDITKRHLRHQTIYERFSWQKLRPEYIKLIQKCM